MSNQINEGAARYTAEKQSQSRPEFSGTQGTQSPQQLVTNHLNLWTSTVTPKSTSGRGRGSGKNSKIELTGIKKLRELILELAVRGKLVAQNPDDEPASKLLERIEGEKAQLIKDGKLKKQKPLAAVSEDEKPFELPEGWEWVRLGHIAQINPRNQIDDITQVSFIPMASVSTSYSGSHDQEIKSWSEVKTGFTHFADGDVAIAKITPCFENSKAAIFSNLSNGVGAGTTELHVARPYGFLEQRFVILVFKSPRYLTEGESQMTGSAGQKRVPKSYFEGTPIQLPPLAEQQRIVAKVDELMNLCDQLEQQSEHQLTAHQQLTDTLLATLTESANAEELNDNWQRLANHFDLLFSGPMGAWAIDRLKDTILQLAVMGKLVPQNPEDEPASKLLKITSAHQQERYKKKEIQKPKSIKTELTLNESLPSSWEKVLLNDLAFITKLAGFEYSKYFKLTDEGEVPVIRAQNVRPFTPNLENLKFIDMSTSEALPRSALDRPCILVTFIGAGIGDVCIFSETNRFHLAPNVAKLELFGPTNLTYLNYFLSSPIGKNELFKSMKSTAQPSLSMTTIREIWVPLPPLTEQHRIVAKVDELFALCDQLKDRLQQASETEQHLTNAIVEQALG